VYMNICELEGVILEWNESCVNMYGEYNAGSYMLIWVKHLSLESALCVCLL